MNRRVRTRMHGGVGSGANYSRLPDWAAKVIVIEYLSEDIITLINLSLLDIYNF